MRIRHFKRNIRNCSGDTDVHERVRIAPLFPRAEEHNKTYGKQPGGADGGTGWVSQDSAGMWASGDSPCAHIPVISWPLSARQLRKLTILKT